MSPYEMEVVVAAHFAQHDVVDFNVRRGHRLDTAELPGVDSTAHGAPARSELHGLASLECRDVSCSPPHPVNFLTLLVHIGSAPCDAGFLQPANRCDCGYVKLT